jgi:Mn-dependent DtxR family transcriptional regulator
MYKVNKNKDPVSLKEIIKEASKKKIRETEVQEIIKELEREGYVSIELGESLMIKPIKEREDFGKIK